MASKRKTAARKGPKAARAKTAATKKAGARRKPPRRGREIEPKSAGTLGIRGSRRGSARELDLATKPSGTLGAGLTRVERDSMPATLGLPASLSLRQAASIVLAAAGRPQGDLDSNLEQAGLITETLRRDFRQRVFEGVRAAGFEIAFAAIPMQPGVTLGQVADAVQAQAR